LFDLPELIEELKGEVSPKWEGRALMAKVRSRATTLASTSVMEASNQGLRNLYEANNDLFVGYEHLSTLDKRTSPICRGRDGLRWDMDEKPIGGHDKVFRWPPLHPRCRSIIQTLMKTWEEMRGAQVLVDPESGKKRSFQRVVGAKRNAVEKQLRRSEDGLVSKNMTYEQFLRRKSDNYAKAVMGPGRHKLWKDGLISQIDLTDSYGNELSLKGLREIAQKRRRN
jgi:SPP1 gp7 family putative phage head morphogenesis protein